MNKEKTSYIIAGFLIIVFIVMWLFNLSFSLPTAFKAMVEKQISKDQQLVITNLDTNKIHSVRIEIPYTSLDEQDVSEIDDKDVISDLLSNELRIYKGGRFKESDEEYDLYVHFYGSIHRYTISEDYIRTFNGTYKVLDKKNDLFEYIKYLYEEE